MKKANHFLNIAMGALGGVYLGRVLFILWNHKVHPEIYGMQSAPWYTAIWVDGLMTLAALLVCLLIKLCLKYIAKKGGK